MTANKLLQNLGLRWRDWETHGKNAKQGFLLPYWWAIKRWWYGLTMPDIEELRPQIKAIQKRIDKEIGVQNWNKKIK